MRNWRQRLLPGNEAGVARAFDAAPVDARAAHGRGTKWRTAALTTEGFGKLMEDPTRE
jgi:hypothetical protein